MLKIASLGSGSAGNATLVCSGETRVLLDCGFTLKETTARLAQLGLSPDSIDAVLVSHEHGDHVRGIGPLSRKFNVPVWLTHGTYHALRDKKFSAVHLINAHQSFSIGDLLIDPFPTPHDAAESCQYIFEFNKVRFAVVTDLGACTPHVEAKLEGLDAMLIESNYDETMLSNGPYPASLQARIRGPFGHLGNEQAGELIARLDHPKLQSILLGHLSEQNNSDQAAVKTVRGHLSSNYERLTVLQQHSCSEWFDIQHEQASQVSVAASAATVSAAKTVSSAEAAITLEEA